MQGKPFTVLFRVAVAVAVVLAFLVPAARLLAARGVAAPPVPLDDVYIYFDFARSTARGCVLCWTEETGFSTGATSPPYALVLALGWAIGFREGALAAFAALVSIVALVDLFASASELAPRPRALALLGPLVLCGVPVLAWSWASGMETAFVAAVVGRAFVAASRAWRSAPHVRSARQLRAGFWIALAAWARPELIPLAGALVVAVGHGAGTTPLLPSLARGAGPLVVGGAVWAALVRSQTGELAAAGAIRKLATSDPYATSFDVAGVWLKNLLRLGTEGVEIGLGGTWSALAIASLAFLSIGARETRRAGAALLLGALAALALVCVNTTAPFQNLRYAAPTLYLLLLGALVGVRALDVRSRVAGVLGTVVLAAAIIQAAGAFPKQIDHFARASRNIAEQQVEVGRRLGALGAERVFVGDAGAIPYVSGLPAIDGLGLGGYHDLPFARASVHGIPAVFELVERLPAEQRPDALALYDSWWPGVGDRFGERWFSVRIEDNVICGADEKVVYRADWRLLEDRREAARGALDRIDVADLVDERDHAVTFTRPRGGYVVDAVLPDANGTRRWDAGRLLAEGQSFAFDLRHDARVETARLSITTDRPAAFEVRLGDAAIEPDAVPRGGEGWLALAVPLPAASPGDRVTVVAKAGGLRIFAVTLHP